MNLPKLSSTYSVPWMLPPGSSSMDGCKWVPAHKSSLERFWHTTGACTEHVTSPNPHTHIVYDLTSMITTALHGCRKNGWGCPVSVTTTFGVVFHIFPIDFPQCCCHAFDDSYHGLYVTNMQQDMGKLWVQGVAKVWDLEA